MSIYHKNVCLNGHSVAPGKARCGTCGEKTITKCPDCGLSIPSALAVFCNNCGNPFPWTEKRLSAARELAKELDSLDDEERVLLTKSIDEIVRDTPKTPVAALRYKEIVSKVDEGAAQAFRELLINVVSARAKKAIWG